MELDYEAVARELVRAVRGDRSQTAFARRIGCRPNTVYTWEAGRRWPPAATFLRAAARVGHDVPGVVRGFLRADPPWIEQVDPASPEGVARLLADLRGDTPIAQIAARAGRSRFAVSRWLSGASEPRLPDLLRMIEATSLRLVDFVAQLTDPGALASTASAWERVVAVRGLARALPWTQLVLLALELAPYRALPAHDAGWLAGRLSLPITAVEEALAALERAGQVRRVGDHYVPVEVLAVDTRRGNQQIKDFWLGVAQERLRGGAEGVFSYNLCAVSEADLARIEEMQRAHYRAIRSLVAASAPAERVVLVQLHLVPLA